MNHNFKFPSNDRERSATMFWSNMGPVHIFRFEAFILDLLWAVPIVHYELLSLDNVYFFEMID